MPTSLQSALLAPPPVTTGGPTHARVRSFIARVEQADYVGAIMHFYHEDAWMQENLCEPRRGRDRLLANEMEILLRYGATRPRKVERFAINGNIVFINWQIEVNVPGVGPRVLDEVAMQFWDGDRIRGERFYYDPEVLRPTGEPPVI